MPDYIYVGLIPPGSDYGEPARQPKRFEPFIISGKAKHVFRLIELKTQRALAAAYDERRFLMPSCPNDPTGTVKCDKPDDITCEQARCIYRDTRF